MIHVAILTGGPSAEREISLNSAGLVEKYLPRDKYTFRTVLMESDGWYEKESNAKMDLNDFSLSINGTKETFDFVFLIIHGTPAEDGKIQGYFELLGIPHSTCSTLVASLTFNKQMCKRYLSTYDIPMAGSVLFTRQDRSEGFKNDLNFPVFVKPNNNGSSYGVSKVSDPDQLAEAIEKAFQFDEEVMVEEFLDGDEYSCGIVKEGDQYHVFPLTQIISKNEFFDYEAKYLGASEEICPAPIDPDLGKECQKSSLKIYKALNCSGMVRSDFILVDGIFYLLEVNTIPGLSEASIIPQQAITYGWTISQLLNVVIIEAMS